MTSRRDGWRRPDGEPPAWTSPWWRWAAAWVKAEFAAGIRTARSVPSADFAPEARVEVRSWRAPRSGPILIGLSVVGAALVLLGFKLHLRDFGVHMMAGAAGLILGAVLAVVLIDKLQRQRRSEQWKLVSDEIRRSVSEGVVTMALEFAGYLHVSDDLLRQSSPAEEPAPDRAVASALKNLVATTAAMAPECALDLDPDRGSSRQLYDQAAVVLPGATVTRLIALGDQPKLVATLMRFERVERLWADWIAMVEQAGAPDRVAWAYATSTLRAGSELYAHFAGSRS